VNLVVVSDTHVPDFRRELPAALLRACEGADAILHAGDATAAFVLELLERHAPVHAVIGNIDRPDVVEWGAQPEIRRDLAGVRVAVVHDSGARAGRERRLRRRFPDAGVIVFGHSHIPVDDEFEGVRLLNPGSPTWKRREPHPTYATLRLRDGRAETAIVPL
jgi:uncharacterized protein